MKAIRELNTPTPGLAGYCDALGAGANWDQFRDHNAGESYAELIQISAGGVAERPC